MKRIFDLVFAFFGFLVLSPILIVVAILIKLDSEGPVFFRQERIGRGFKPFYIYKFRTMVKDEQERGGIITSGEDARITRIGRILRNAKIDELPQIINVLKGEMSFVGPRPEVRQYVEMFRQDYAEILKVRPGITDLASLKYRNEALILGEAKDSNETYVRLVLPDKICLAKEYLRCSSLSFDLTLIFKTLFRLVH